MRFMCMISYAQPRSVCAAGLLVTITLNICERNDIMKLVTFQKKGTQKEEVGLFISEGIVPVRAAGLNHDSMNDLIRFMTEEEKEKLQSLAQSYSAGMAPASAPEVLPLDSVTLLSPIPRPLQDVLCLGLNYTEHAAEAAAYSNEAFSGGKDAPVFFSKRVSYSQGTGAPIPSHSDLTSRLDYECELGVIIGTDARDIAAEDAEKVIFGYTIVNDVSARDLQTTHKQWYFGKSLDGFTPMGPCIVTADETAFPPALRISTRVNGELRQDSTTDLLIHGIPGIIETLSKGMTLCAGTIIATGTPKGVAMGMDDPVFLKPGDEVRCEIEGIGTLVNTIC